MNSISMNPKQISFKQHYNVTLLNLLKPNLIANSTQTQQKQQTFQHKCNLSSMLMIPCINCEEHVQSKEIDEHSQKCTIVTKKVKDFSKSHKDHEEIDFKIIQLQGSLKQMMNSVNRPYQIVEFKYLCRANQIAEAVIAVNSLNFRDEQMLIDMQSELIILCGEYEGYQGVKLPLRRLQSLVIQKLFVYFGRTFFFSTKDNRLYAGKDQNHSDTSLSNLGRHQLQKNQSESSQYRVSESISQTSTREQLKLKISDTKKEIIQSITMASKYQQQTQDSQSKVNSLLNINNKDSPYKKIAQTPQGIPNLNLGANTFKNDRYDGNIQSMRDPKTTNKNLFLSQMHPSNLGLSVDEFQQLSERSTTDELQRLFYQMCFNQKLKISQNHPSQKIPVSLLYKEAQYKLIDHTQWKDFISSALNCPYKYLDKSKIENYHNEELMKNKLNYIPYPTQFKNQIQKR